MVCTTTVSSRGVFPVDGSARGEDFYLAIRGDFYLATRGDMNLATRGDFFMATDKVPTGPPRQTDLRAPGTKTKPASQQAAQRAFHGSGRPISGHGQLI
jgi:hypothetical protein